MLHKTGPSGPFFVQTASTARWHLISTSPTIRRTASAWSGSLSGLAVHREGKVDLSWF